MPSFTQEQEAFIEKVAFAASQHILKTHIETCPYGKKLARALWFVLGFGIGSGTLAGFGLANLIS